MMATAVPQTDKVVLLARRKTQRDQFEHRFCAALIAELMQRSSQWDNAEFCQEIHLTIKLCSIQDLLFCFGQFRRDAIQVV